MIYSTRKQQKLEKEIRNFIGRSYRNYNPQKFSQDLRCIDWTNTLNKEHPEAIQKINISQKKKPWLSTELLEYLVDKDNYLAIAKRTKTTEDIALAHFHRNEAKRLTKLAKQQYYTDRVRRYENNTKILENNTWDNFRQYQRKCFF